MLCINVAWHLQVITRANNVDKCSFILERTIIRMFIHTRESLHKCREGAQWLSGRVPDSRPKGRGFEPHRRHCVVVLEQDTFILA